MEEGIKTFIHSYTIVSYHSIDPHQFPQLFIWTYSTQVVWHSEEPQVSKFHPWQNMVSFNCQQFYCSLCFGYNFIIFLLAFSVLFAAKQRISLLVGNSGWMKIYQHVVGCRWNECVCTYVWGIVCSTFDAAVGGFLLVLVLVFWRCRRRFFFCLAERFWWAKDCIKSSGHSWMMPS